MIAQGAAVKIAPERLREIFDLRPGGTLVWKRPSKYHMNVAGRVAGCSVTTHSGKRYWTVSIDGKKFKRSRLVYCMTTGKWPADEIDHIDGNSLNDSPSNLREATQMQNSWNHKGRRKKTGLPMGVKRLASGNYQARIRANHRCIALGAYPTQEAASEAYQVARIQNFGRFA